MILNVSFSYFIIKIDLRKQNFHELFVYLVKITGIFTVLSCCQIV